eukprot:gnl/Spiro4/10115_TR5370_c0_g1_i1.p1 gnl/Spiro4/10115_TR5370_c0_g1~~gnl/Spiro4/10115_TR5370_c0_g1_i1.p1  ORF type:complete len:634 (+),score=99.48 gnl/Spiro4/10115_TR5370_c0_g1_i1:133-2034(+)
MNTTPQPPPHITRKPFELLSNETFYLFFAVFSAWMFGYFGMSVLWIMGPLYFVAFLLRTRRETELKNRSASDLAFVRSVRATPDMETSEWLNVLVRRVWPVYRLELANWFANMLNPILDRHKPASLDSISIERIAFGTVHHPFIEYIKGFDPQDISENRTMTIDVNFKYIGAATVDLAVRVRSVNMLVNMAVGVDSIVGKLRIKVELVDRFPWCGVLHVSFVNRPKIDMSIHLSNVINLMEIPGISSWLRNLISVQLLGVLIEPQRITLPFDEWFNPSEAQFGAGVLQIRLLGARDLVDRNLLRTCQAYCVVSLSGSTDKEYRSAVVRGTTPTWDEVFDVVIDNIGRQSLNIEVFDRAKFMLSSDECIGTCTLSLADVIPGQEKDVWLTLSKTKSGSVHIILKFKSLLEAMVSSAQRSGSNGGSGGGASPGGVPRSRCDSQAAQRFACADTGIWNPDHFLDTISRSKSEGFPGGHGRLVAGLPSGPAVGVLEVTLVSITTLSPLIKGSRSLFCTLRVADDTKQSSLVKVDCDANPRPTVRWNEFFKFVVRDPQSEKLYVQLKSKHRFKENGVHGTADCDWTWILDGMQHDVYLELESKSSGHTTLQLKLAFKALRLDDGPPPPAPGPSQPCGG